jgi:hypothetical protein
VTSGINSQPGVAHKTRIDESTSKNAKEINKISDEIDDRLDDLRNRIQSAIDDNQTDFFEAFKLKMVDIMKDMSELRDKADAEKLKLKQDAKLIQLEQERDWFRSESMRLSKVYKE